ncbi:MAG: hypothetical protein GY928_15885 [Colwellia sp.]|nr:hypothetical protein [Colwellia sp.]
MNTENKVTEVTPINLLIGQVTKLTDSVDKLVNIDAARIEREKQQEKENIKVAKFMTENSEPLARLKRQQSRFDKWGDKIGYSIIVVASVAIFGKQLLQ